MLLAIYSTHIDVPDWLKAMWVEKCTHKDHALVVKIDIMMHL